MHAGAAFLIGGGWNPLARPLVYGPFLEAAGRQPRVACVVLDQGDREFQFDRLAAALTAAAPCTPTPVFLEPDRPFDIAAIGDADALLVCGGSTPVYAAALAPFAGPLRDWLRDGSRPYAGFSAGAAIAAERALVGGWRVDGIAVCPEDASEDLDELAVVTGLGLIPFTVDVHAAQWGTLPRLIAAVDSGRVTHGVAIDEDTAVIVEAAGRASVCGLGRVHAVSAADGAIRVRTLHAGDRIEIAG